VALGGLGAERVEAVLLDGLGTLVALQPPWPAFAERLRAAHGVHLAPADAERAFRAEMAYYRSHHQEGRDEGTLAELRTRCARALRAQLPREVARSLSTAQVRRAMLEALRFAAYPDAPAALAALRARGVALVVVSNWDVSLPAVLRKVGLAGSVDGVVTSAAVGHPKPRRAVFDAALALAGCPARMAVHVGDSVEHDVCGALAVGIRPVLLCRDGAQPEPEKLPPGVARISSLTELLTA
jgi:putative hydrolase of the HAD superfamily